MQVSPERALYLRVPFPIISENVYPIYILFNFADAKPNEDEKI